MIYAKDIKSKLVYPQDAEFIGIVNWRANDTAQRLRGYRPLVGEADEREGYTATPSAWHVVEGTETRIEPRQVIPGGVEMVDRAIVYDTSYLQVDTWEYTPIPVPPPEPPPIVIYSKYRIQRACQKRGIWEKLKESIASAGLQDSWANIVDIASDNRELKDALPDIRAAFGSDTVDAVLAEAIAD